MDHNPQIQKNPTASTGKNTVPVKWCSFTPHVLNSNYSNTLIFDKHQIINVRVDGFYTSPGYPFLSVHFYIQKTLIFVVQ